MQPRNQNRQQLMQAQRGRHRATTARGLTLEPTKAVSARLRIGPISQMPSVGSVKRSKSATEAVGAASTTVPVSQHNGHGCTAQAATT